VSPSGGQAIGNSPMPKRYLAPDGRVYVSERAWLAAVNRARMEARRSDQYPIESKPQRTIFGAAINRNSVFVSDGASVRKSKKVWAKT